MKTIKLLGLILCLFTISLTAQETTKGEANAIEPSTVSLEKLVQQKSADYVITAEHVSRTSGSYLFVIQGSQGKIVKQVVRE